MPSKAGKPTQWDPTAEHDLTMAAWLSTCNGDLKPNWVMASEKMQEWGYTFSKDAMTQRWSKKIYKDFKERHPGAGNPSAAENRNEGDVANGEDGAKVATKRKRAAPKPAKTKAEVKADTDEDEQHDDFPKAKKPARRARARATAKTSKRQSKTEDANTEAMTDDSNGEMEQADNDYDGFA